MELALSRKVEQSKLGFLLSLTSLKQRSAENMLRWLGKGTNTRCKTGVTKRSRIQLNEARCTG